MLKHLLNTRPEFIEITNSRAVDGDTLQAHLILPLGIWVQRRIRLKGFFAPEHKGASPDLAHAAAELLQSFCDAHVCLLRVTGMREDRFGRLAAELWTNAGAVDPVAVLGPLNLTPEAHRAEVIRARQVQP